MKVALDPSVPAHKECQKLTEKVEDSMLPELPPLASSPHRGPLLMAAVHKELSAQLGLLMFWMTLLGSGLRGGFGTRILEASHSMKPMQSMQSKFHLVFKSDHILNTHPVFPDLQSKGCRTQCIHSTSSFDHTCPV